MRYDRGAALKFAEARSIVEVTLDGGDTVSRVTGEMLSKPISEPDFLALAERLFVPAS